MSLFGNETVCDAFLCCEKVHLRRFLRYIPMHNSIKTNLGEKYH